MRPLLAPVGGRHEVGGGGGRGSLQLLVRMMHDMDLKQTCRVYMTTSKRTQDFMGLLLMYKQWSIPGHFPSIFMVCMRSM